jgi:hypothetical protein
MWCTHKYDPGRVFENIAKMSFGIVTRQQNSFLADEATEAVRDENERTAGRVTGVSIVR